jgi:hypothetical protein
MVEDAVSYELLSLLTANLRGHFAVFRTRTEARTARESNIRPKSAHSFAI